MRKTKAADYSIDNLNHVNPCALLHGDVRSCLLAMPQQSANLIVTSPPYYDLRDYGEVGQIGNEATVDEYIAGLSETFRQMLPILRDDGTFWLNIGDTYSGSGELYGVPWRLAFALQSAGWKLRADIIWSKPNAMPESVKNRPSRQHEYLFLFAKSDAYYYDWYAIREESEIPVKIEVGVRKGSTADSTGMYAHTGNGGNEKGVYKSNGITLPPSGRNARTVWEISTQSYKGAHFATFPEKLVERIVKAGTSEYGYCGACGSPYVREVESFRQRTRPGKTTKVTETTSHGNRDTGRHCTYYTDKGFKPSCPCAFPARPGIVLDPFVGSGTAVAESVHLGRFGIGIDNSETYLRLARDRISKVLRLRNTEYQSPKIIGV